MKINFTFFLLFFLYKLNSQTYNPKSSLKEYSGSSIITTQVRAERNKAVLRGTEANQNRAFVLENYNGIQPSVYPGFGGFWPEIKPKNINNIKFETKDLDQVVNWGLKNNFYIIHHCLFFPNKYFPKWFGENSYSKLELENLLENYIKSVLNANNNKEKIDVFNVINEVFENNKGYYRKSNGLKEDLKWVELGFEPDRSELSGKSKINTQHPIFIKKVLETTSRLTDAKLEIRDFNIAFGGHKADGLYQLVKHLINSGIKIDAVGFQCHLNVNTNYDYNKFSSNIKRFIDLGLEVYITELDVGVNLWQNGKKGKVEDYIKSEDDWKDFFIKQNEVYYNVIKTARESEIKLISDWGFRDNIPYSNWRKGQKARMLNKDYSKKGSYYSVLKALYETRELTN